MSVDDRLRAGLDANARTVDPDVEAGLEATLHQHRRGRATRWVLVATLAAACVALIVALGGVGGDKAAPPVPATRTTRTNEAARIPDGLWSRDVTVAELMQAGLTPSPELLASNGLDDGQGRVFLRIEGDRWTHLIEANNGELLVGDRGTTSYDSQGRWVLSGLIDIGWSVTGNTLTTSGIHTTRADVPVGDDVHFALEGVWTKTP